MERAPYVDYNMPEPERLVECPYNKAHQILRHRFQTHIIKCRRSYHGKQFVTCRYNASHVFPEPEIKLHEKTCESKIDLWRFLYNEKDPKGEDEKPKPPQPKVSSHCPHDEEWDDDTSPAYDPQKYCETANIIRNIQHMTPSQRKAMREAERRRIHALNAKMN